MIQTPPPPLTYRVAPGVGQQIRFIAHTTVETYAGVTNTVSGAVQVRSDKPDEGLSARFVVDLSQLSTGNGLRDSNMRTRFLQTDKYPTATFVLSRLQTKVGAQLRFNTPVQGNATGAFTLHGVTRAISPVVIVTRERDTAGHDTIHIVANFSVLLRDYNIAAPRFLFVAVKQEHAVSVDVRAVAP